MWVKQIGKKKFIVRALDSNDEIFVVHVSSFDNFNLYIHLFFRAQIALLI